MRIEALSQQHHIALIFGTRPEIIKLSPVFAALAENQAVELSAIYSGQQADLAPEFLTEFGIPIDHELDVMRTGQSLSQLMANLISSLEQCLSAVQPDAVLVQGDTSTALAGALVANLKKIPVFHVEAGLRTFDSSNPFPEETNRQLIAKLTNHHYAVTKGNRENLLGEGIRTEEISISGNPIVDIVMNNAKEKDLSPLVKDVLQKIRTDKWILLTAHRRENFDSLMAEYFAALARYLDQHPDTSVAAVVHPNPSAMEIFDRVLSDHPRVIAVEPMGYRDFLSLLQRATLIVSDSGGIQEEAVSLKRPLIVLRKKTERPEAVDCGLVKLAPTAKALEHLVETFHAEHNFTDDERNFANPFGDGKAGKRIADSVVSLLASASP